MTFRFISLSFLLQFFGTPAVISAEKASLSFGPVAVPSRLMTQCIIQEKINRPVSHPDFKTECKSHNIDYSKY